MLYDRELWLSEGQSRFDKAWRNKKRSWSALLELVSTTQRTHETYKDFLSFSKTEQDNIKDVGGFVAGVLEGGKRSAETVTSREVVTLDLDNAPVDFWADYSLLAERAAAYYTTHKHSPEKPRIRLLIPLSRAVTPEEYEAIARWLAFEIGMPYMDKTTFQPSRLMFWPSTSSDGAFEFDSIDAPFTDPDEVLANYADWRDVSQWPLCDGEVKETEKRLKKASDPKTKQGVVGAFCRAYNVPEAIAKFIPEVYERTSKNDRYTYAAGTSAGGLVIYNGGDLAYSNHSTDPAGGMALNAFDIVRIHKFDATEDPDEKTPINKRPSYLKMIDFAGKDTAVKAELIAAQLKPDEFDDAADWTNSLKLNKSGAIEKTEGNLALILANDPKLQGIAYDELAEKVTVKQDMPWERKGLSFWEDVDDTALGIYLEAVYKVGFPKQWRVDQVQLAAHNNRFHPIKVYLENLKWDGIARADTLIIDALNAKDSIYTREATAKILLAAVKRIYEPGAKFDNMVVLNGPQGCGKSTIISLLGGRWFSDSLNFDDMKTKEGYDKLRGYWLFEISEMKGMRKTDIESIKSFISSQHDEYRAAYGRHAKQYFRQCVFFGTVNGEDGFLRDWTGNRRFWPIEVKGGGNVFDLGRSEINQIWAEIFHRYKSGERNLLLSKEAEKLAKAEQVKALEHDDREGLVAQYLERKLPWNWCHLDIVERLDFLDSDEEGTDVRQKVCVMEIWCECFRMRKAAITRSDSLAIASILKALGWERSGQKDIPQYGRPKVYSRANQAK